MNNKLPVEVRKDNIFTKIFKFLKGIFDKQDENIINKEATKISTFKENSLDELKIEPISKRSGQKVIEEIIQLSKKILMYWRSWIYIN